MTQSIPNPSTPDDLVLVPRRALRTLIEELEWFGDHSGTNDDPDCVVCKAIAACRASLAMMSEASKSPEVVNAHPA